jgi:hypothetical protein
LSGNPKIPLAPPFSKGEIRVYSSESIQKALLPLKKGGREGFQGKLLKRAKHLRMSKFETIFQYQNRKLDDLVKSNIFPPLVGGD